LRDAKTLEKVSRIKKGEAIMRVQVDVVGLQKRKEVEALIRVDKNDIVGDCQVLVGARSNVEEKRSVTIAKACLRFAVSYAIIFGNIIASAVAGDYTKLVSGMFPWYIVFIVSIPSAIGSVYSIDRTKPGN
jgi:hypothetical protein